MAEHLKHRLLKVGVAAVALWTAALSPLQAGTVTGSFTVTATVTGGACTSISASAMSFGNIAPTGTASSTSTLTINCASGTSYSITAGGSTFEDCEANSIYNLMGPIGTHSPEYTLFKDAAHTLLLSNGTQCATASNSALTGTGSGSNQTQTLYGVVYGTAPGNTTTPAGSYSDTATVTLTF